MQTVQSSFSYAVFRFIKDARGDVSIPIGVALWSEDLNWVNVRLVQPGERIRHLSKTNDQPFIGLFERKLREWLASSRLPYGESSLKPSADSWWEHLQKIQIHKIRISAPRPIDCVSPDIELETLFNEVVGKTEDIDESVRIDHLISRCLGASLAKQLRRGEVTGFAGKPVQVMRLFSGHKATVVLEGVNLALENAAEQADALVGKLQRVRENGSPQVHEERNIIAIVGYVASRDGLNGETYLKNWIEKKGEAVVLDVERETERLREKTIEALRNADLPPMLR